MKKSTSPKVTHLSDPRNAIHTDHKVEAHQVDNVHRYELRCSTCNKHIKWASELEYFWIVSRPKPVSFRNLYWAPTYDSEYRLICDELIREKRAGEYQPYGYWEEVGRSLVGDKR